MLIITVHYENFGNLTLQFYFKLNEEKDSIYFTFWNLYRDKLYIFSIIQIIFVYFNI